MLLFVIILATELVILMFLFLTLFQSFFMSIPDADGWVVLEQEKSFQEEEIEEDGKGVLFSLSYQDTLFWVRFLKEPAYSYEKKGLVLESKSDSIVQRLEVKNALSVEEDFFLLHKKELEKKVFLEEAIQYEDGRSHFSYWVDGKWVAEEWIVRGNYSYFFYTESDKTETQLHIIFFTSLIN